MYKSEGGAGGRWSNHPACVLDVRDIVTLVLQCRSCFLLCTGGADGGAARVYGYEGRLICELKTKGEFIFVYVWAMGLTSCFVYRVRPAGRFVRRVRLSVAGYVRHRRQERYEMSPVPGHECRSARGRGRDAYA